MSLVINATQSALELKDYIMQHLTEEGYTITDLTQTLDQDVTADVDVVTLNTTQYVQSHPNTKAIIIDNYGITPFILANKQRHIICAMVSEEQSAKMTLRHNNTNTIVMGHETIGRLNALNCARSFLTSHYDGGRHQIRVDMLNELC